jgi:flavin reductase (DIM6/NTAB) family NADH-FMN oxidoreductase RutF
LELDFAGLDLRVAYRWMASTITPRPVAWVSSLSATGIANLAPFSFFQMITANPPTLMFSPLIQSDGRAKDTVANIKATGEFVVNLVSFAQVDLMNETSYTFDPNESEFERCNVPSEPARRVKPMRVKGAPVAFECKLAKLMPYPEQSPSCFVVFGEVLYAHFDESILGEKGYVDPDRLNLVSRMGGNWYGRTATSANFELERPTGWDRKQNT